MKQENKILHLLQYILLVAGQSDESCERSLSPLQLIKYLYLLDMDYAKYHNGEIYTGIRWKFHHFGPWAVEPFLEIDEALDGIGARKTTFSSAYGDKDCVRWFVVDGESQFAKLKNELPIDIRHSIGHYVQSFHNNTTALLHFVYATPPMLNAAPGEFLDFSFMTNAKTEKAAPFVPYLMRLSKNKRKALHAGMSELRERFQKSVREAVPCYQVSSGRTDAVYEEGVAWLDELTGKPFPDDGMEVRFSDDVWKSNARSGND